MKFERQGCIEASADEAKIWVNTSTLPENTKEGLLSFIKCFPELTFYKELPQFIDAIEAAEQVKLPEWLRAIRQTLAYVAYEQLVWVRFDQFTGWSPRSDNLEQIWYMLGLRGYDNEDQRGLLDEINFFPIGEWLETGQSSLAIQLNHSENQKIYEYAEEDLWDNLASGDLLIDASHIVFDSYVDMLSHIVAIRIGSNGRVIEAK